jgi:hypothetical protein
MGMSFPAIRLNCSPHSLSLASGAAAPTRPWAARRRLPTSELPAAHSSRPRRPHAAAGVQISEPRGTTKRSEKGTNLPELEREVQSSSASLPRLAPGSAGSLQPMTKRSWKRMAGPHGNGTFAQRRGLVTAERERASVPRPGNFVPIRGTGTQRSESWDGGGTRPEKINWICGAQRC